MRQLYGEDATVTTADESKDWLQANRGAEIEAVKPWGWDARTRNLLMKNGIQPTMQPLPDDTFLYKLRHFQHRTSILPLQPHARQADNIQAVSNLLDNCKRIVLKAPLSGSGRGLRWVDSQMSEHDIHWTEKTIASQGCVIVEQRINVSDNFAFEFFIDGHNVSLLCLSLFETQSGVYRHNILLNDSDIKSHLHLPDNIEENLVIWLDQNLMSWYHGPVGIDMMRDTEGHFHVCEMNLRHTMGMVAHQYLNTHTEKKCSLFKPFF